MLICDADDELLLLAAEPYTDVVVVTDDDVRHQAWLDDLLSFWPEMPDLEGGIDLFEHIYGPAKGQP